MILGGRFFKTMFFESWRWEIHTRSRVPHSSTGNLASSLFFDYLYLSQTFKPYPNSLYKKSTNSLSEVVLHYLAMPSAHSSDFLSIPWSEMKKQKKKQTFPLVSIYFPLGFSYVFVWSYVFVCCLIVGNEGTRIQHTNTLPLCLLVTVSTRKKNCVIMPLVSSTWSLRFPSTYFFHHWFTIKRRPLFMFSFVSSFIWICMIIHRLRNADKRQGSHGKLNL